MSVTVEYKIWVDVPGKLGHKMVAEVKNDEKAAYALYESMCDVARSLYPVAMVTLRYKRRERDLDDGVVTETSGALERRLLSI